MDEKLRVLEKMKMIEGKIDAFNQVFNWSLRPDINVVDLRGMISAELLRVEKHVSLLKFVNESII